MQNVNVNGSSILLFVGLKFGSSVVINTNMNLIR